FPTGSIRQSLAESTDWTAFWRTNPARNSRTWTIHIL
ncbi:MAG: hypothetical protein ACI91B_004607, partial [Planctomycetota bacterium]